MKSITVLGILLAVLGIFALVYQGFSYTRQEKFSMWVRFTPRETIPSASLFRQSSADWLCLVELLCSSSARSKRRNAVGRRCLRKDS